MTQQPVLHFGSAPSFPSLSRCLWMFAWLGPAFGYVTAMLVLTVTESDNLLQFMRFPLVLVMGIPVALPIAYMLGVVPATVVGAAYWALRSKAMLNPVPAVSLSVVASILACAAVLVVMDRGGVEGLLDLPSWGLMMLPGVLATLLCAYIVERRG
jgi:hypothetical protein